MELTVNQIKEKQKDLERNIQEICDQFEQLTGVYVVGQVGHKSLGGEKYHVISLVYSNPFGYDGQ